MLTASCMQFCKLSNSAPYTRLLNPAFQEKLFAKLVHFLTLQSHHTPLCTFSSAIAAIPVALVPQNKPLLLPTIPSGNAIRHQGCQASCVCVGAQMRAHWYNLWVDKRGKSLGPRPDAILMDGPLLKVHWPLLVLWVIGAGLKIGTEVPFGR